jgi:ADP-heptose:LPS heptosyltransferase
MTKILIIRFSSIGDIILTTPVIRNLKQQLPNAEIHYCTKLKFKSLLEHNPYLDKIHCLDNSLKELLSQLKAEKYDYIIDLHNNLRSFIIKLNLNKKSYTFDKLNIKKWIYVNFKIDLLPDVHIVDRYMDTVKKLGIKNDQSGLDYFIPQKDEINISHLPESHRGNYAAYAIGAQHNTKKLPLNKIIELCETIHTPVILLGDGNDKEIADQVEEHFRQKNKNKIYNACGKYNLNQSASLLKQASLVISHDTGLMHLASAFKKEIYSIWGNTTPRFGMYPYLTKYTVLEKKGLSCRPCSKIGYSKCPQSHFKCMNEIKLDLP